MGRREIEYDLDYFEDGIIKTETLKINFVSNRCRREYNEIISGAYEVQNLFDNINYKTANISALKKEKPKDYKKNISDIEKEILIFVSKIEKYGETQILQKRYEIVKKILEQNNITDEKFFNFEFWDENVDPSDIINFLDKCIFKDIDTKKKDLAKK